MIEENKFDVLDALFRGCDDAAAATTSKKASRANFFNRLPGLFYRTKYSNSVEGRWLGGTKTDRELYLFAKQNHFLFCLKIETGFSNLYKQVIVHIIFYCIDFFFSIFLKTIECFYFFYFHFSLKLIFQNQKVFVRVPRTLAYNDFAPVASFENSIGSLIVLPFFL